MSGTFDELLAWCDRELLPVLPQSSGEEKAEESGGKESIQQLAKDCLMVSVFHWYCVISSLSFDKYSGNIFKFLQIFYLIYRLLLYSLY